MSDPIYVLDHDCKGPNKKCRAAHKEGRIVHVNTDWNPLEPTLVQPTHHFVSEDHGRAMIASWMETAVTVTCDAELYACRAAGVAHKLPVGWVDPDYRR